MVISNLNKQRIKDIFFNVSATLILNCVLQFLCYPIFEKKLGTELNGVALALLSVVAITAGSFGSAESYSRLINEKNSPTNGDYNSILLVGGLISVAIGLVYMWIKDLITPLDATLFSVLLFLTAIRYYSNVEYKLKGNFKHYFIYHLFISVGYVLGIILFNLCGAWALAIIIGEAFAFVYAFFSTTLFKRDLKISKNLPLFIKSVALLVTSSVLENLTLNADRIILLSIVSGTAVTYFYVASLFGKVIALLTVPINSLVISYLVRYNGNLNKKMWSYFLLGALVLGTLGTLGCVLGSYVIIPFLYDFFGVIQPILLPAILSQIFFFVSSVLLVVLLRFYGEKRQFLFNLIYAIIFFAMCIVCTILFGLNGFVYASLVTNALRLALVAIIGSFLCKKDDRSVNNEKTEVGDNI